MGTWMDSAGNRLVLGDDEHTFEGGCFSMHTRITNLDAQRT